MNTPSTPKTIFEVPGLSCSIMKIPQIPMMSGEEFQQQLLQSKNKGEALDILCRRGSQFGWFSDMPEGLFDKLAAWRSIPSKSA